MRTLIAASAVALLSLDGGICGAFVHRPSHTNAERWRPLPAAAVGGAADDGGDASAPPDTRRSFLSASVTTGLGISAAAASSMIAPTVAYAEDDSAPIESIAERAARISRSVGVRDQAKAEVRQEIQDRLDGDKRTIYDFSLPVAGEPVPFDRLVGQVLSEPAEVGDEMYGGSGGPPTGKVKAILLVNIKQDDPIARKNIPEMIALATKFRLNGEFVVVACPTDQGYYEPDTSALLRLKLKSEYGYGINPATVVTDKVNILGTGAHPLWRWIEGRSRTPAGLGRIEANFEKFLIDGQTGLPVRRYPRKFSPYEIQEDIEALVRGHQLPPVTADWKEGWRGATKDAEADTYRFQKGLNVFDQ